MAQRVLTFVVVKLGYIPSGREAPAIVQPRGLPVEQVRHEIWAEARGDGCDHRAV